VDIYALVRHCTATDNHSTGIVALGGSMLLENRASHNGLGGGAGIVTSAGSGSRVESNQGRDNGSGFLCTSDDIVIRNTAGNNSVKNFDPNSGTNFGPVQFPSATSNPMANIEF